MENCVVIEPMQAVILSSCSTWSDDQADRASWLRQPHLSILLLCRRASSLIRSDTNPCLCAGSSNHKNPATQPSLALLSLAVLSQPMDFILVWQRGAHTLSCQVSGSSKIHQRGKFVYLKHLRQLNLCSQTLPAVSHATWIKRKCKIILIKNRFRYPMFEVSWPVIQCPAMCARSNVDSPHLCTLRSREVQEEGEDPSYAASSLCSVGRQLLNHRYTTRLLFRSNYFCFQPSLLLSQMQSGQGTCICFSLYLLMLFWNVTGDHSRSEPS